MHCPCISSASLAAWLVAGAHRASALAAAAARFRSGRSSRTSASCWPTGSCSWTATRRSAPPTSTSCRTARARSAATARPAGGAVATEAPAAPARSRPRSSRVGADVAGARRATTPARPRRASRSSRSRRKDNGGIKRHSPADRRGIAAGRRRRLRGRARRSTPSRGATPAVFGPHVGVDAITARDAVLGHCASRSTARLSYDRPDAGIAAGYAYGWENDYRSHSRVGHHARRPLRPQLHAGPVVHAQLRQRLRRQQRRRRPRRWTCSR